MVYTPNVPLSGQSLGETRDVIRANFEDINTAFGANHTPLTTDDSGKHLFLQMPEQVSAPSTVGNEGGVYTKEGPSGTTELYFRAESNGAEYQLTNVSIGSSANLGANPGYTFLPGGVIMQYGSFVPGASTGTTNFANTFPTGVFGVWLQIKTNSTGGRTVQITSFTTTSFSWVIPTVTDVTEVYYQALGN